MMMMKDNLIYLDIYLGKCLVTNSLEVGASQVEGNQEGFSLEEVLDSRDNHQVSLANPQGFLDSQGEEDSKVHPIHLHQALHRSSHNFKLLQLTQVQLEVAYSASLLSG
jgi:hypothetical protein